MQFSQDDIDIRDINSGETYYAVTSDASGGRCVNHGMFRAAWREKAKAKEAINDEAGLRVVKCQKP
jgi:hypothetical protein